jgi:hypothetical protein
MSPILHRAVILITGQGDELATPYAGCNGGCHQGDCACDCELSLSIAPDDQRVIAAPLQTPEDRAAIARIRRNTVALIFACFSVLATLLGIANARLAP